MPEPTAAASLMYSPMMLKTRSRSNCILQCESLKRKYTGFESDYRPPEKRFKEDTTAPSSLSTFSIASIGARAQPRSARSLYLARKRQFQNLDCSPDQEVAIQNKRQRKIENYLCSSSENHQGTKAMAFSRSLNLSNTTTDNNYLNQVSSSMQSPEFSSFAYFQPIIPDLDQEIDQFLHETKNQSSMNEEVSESKHEDPNFNTFNYWRVPIPDINFDILCN